MDDLRNLQEELSRLNSMVDSEGWRYLEEIAAAQVENRRNEFELTPLASLDSTLGQEFKKGEISGIRLFMRLPTLRIEELKDAIKEELTNGQHDEV